MPRRAAPMFSEGLTDSSRQWLAHGGGMADLPRPRPVILSETKWSRNPKGKRNALGSWRGEDAKFIPCFTVIAA